VHAQKWPTVGEIDALTTPDAEAHAALDRAIEVITEIRRVKSQAYRPPKARIAVARVRTDAGTIPILQRLEVDLRSAAGADRVELAGTDTPLNVELEFVSELPAAGAPPE
jgi:valyl-tRNA synthetase